MSHPAASVKSIFSGKMNLDTPDELEPYDYSNNNSFENYSGNEVDNDDVLSRDSEKSNLSVNSKNLKALASMQPNSRLNSPFYNQSSFTNVSIVSSGSDYQQNYVSSSVNSPNVALSSDSMSELNHNLLPYESYSRPLSRNSTTSCLSTTATKDGIEGRKLHRHGPTQYSSNIIASMIQNSSHQNKYSHGNSEALGSTHKSYPPAYTHKLPDANSMVAGQEREREAERDEVSVSHSSIKSTNAAVDGETGDKKNMNIEAYLNAVPPVSLKEKINLLNTDTVNQER